MAINDKEDEHELTRYDNEELRIVMVGKTGVGKSATGNTILGKEVFKSEFSPKSLTTLCKKADGEVDGQKVCVIDTPGLFDTRNNEEKTRKDIAQCISYASPGPHVFLIVIKPGRFTEEEKQTLQRIQEIFGEETNKYSLVLFTHGDLLKEQTIEEFLLSSEDLQELVDKCSRQYHVFNNDLKDRSQVSELLNKVKNIIEKNGGGHYTTDMFQRAEKAIEDKKKQILREKQEEMRKELEKIKRSIRKTKEVSLLACPHLQMSFPGCLAPQISLLGSVPFRYHLRQYNRPLMVGGCIVFSFRGQCGQMFKSKFLKYVINYKDIMKTSHYISYIKYSK